MINNVQIIFGTSYFGGRCDILVLTFIFENFKNIVLLCFPVVVTCIQAKTHKNYLEVIYHQIFGFTSI